MEDKIKVICFLDNPLGRDTEIVLPVTFCMEEYLNCEVTFLFLWDMLKIKFIKPDIILLPNTRGHNVYFEIAKFGHQCGITILALESEGNFRTDGKSSFWGYNIDKIHYQKLLICWSERIRNYLMDQRIASQDKLVVTGGTGFDRYIFEQSENRESFLAKYNKLGYKKVIGYAGWAFGKIFGREKNFAMYSYGESIEQANNWVNMNRIFVREVLRKIIVRNPDILFLLKKHPKESYEDDIVEWPNEMNELLEYPNTMYFKTEEDIKTLISISDLWMGFETTTLMESWLMKKETILINNEVDFPRGNLFKGSLIASDFESLQQYIDEFYAKGRIEQFYNTDLLSNRQKLVSESIGFQDGLNHLRTIKAFLPHIKKNRNQQNIPINFRHLRLFVLMHLGRWFYNRKLFSGLPKFKKTIYVFENRSLPGFKERRKELYSNLKIFHISLIQQKNQKYNKNDFFERLLKKV